MDDIYALLNLNGEILSNFAFQANLVENKDTERTINRNVRKLEQIGRRHDSEIECKMSAHSINVVVQKVLRKALENSREDISFSELRIISYNLSQFHGAEKAYFYALALLEEEWKDMFLRGIASYLLTSWNYIREDYRSRCIDLFTSKAQSYSGTIERYINLRANIDFFKDNGPMRLGALLIRKRIPLMEAPGVIGYKPSAFANSYFSDTIIKFINEEIPNSFDFLENEIFAYHQEDRTKKLVYANLVMTAEELGDTMYQSKISASARRILGDISLTATWAPFQGASDDEISILRRASELVNLWVNRLAIEAFFDVCVQDKTRANFWLEYAKDMSYFKIAGSSIVRNQLKQDPRIDNSILKDCFVDISSQLSRTSALILVFKGKAIVEFSDIGAVYAYNVTNLKISPILKGIIKKNIRIDQLKDTSLPTLYGSQDYYSILYDEMRMSHVHRWQPRLSNWLKQKVFVSSNVAPYQQKVDKVFKAKPISYKQPKLDNEPIRKNSSVKEGCLIEGKADPHPEIVESQTERSTTLLAEEIKPVNSKKSCRSTAKNEPHPDIEDSETVISTILRAEEPKAVNSINIHKEERINQKNPTAEWSTSDPGAFLYSKWVLDGLYQIVGASKGFYIHMISNNSDRYVRIKSYRIDRTDKGSIWIKKTNADGWKSIVYAIYNIEEFEIGQIKCLPRRLLFRKSIDSPDCLSFPID